MLAFAMRYFFFAPDLPHTILALKAGGEGLMRGPADPCVVIEGNDTVLLLPASVSTI